MGMGLVAGGIAAAGSIGSSMISSSASKSAAKAQTDAANTAAQTQLSMYNQTRSDLAPYLTTGNSALASLAKMFGIDAGGTGTISPDATKSLENYPGYQFALNQGQTALDRSAASKGLLLSGGQIKDSQSFGQGLATQTFGNYYNQLLGLSQLGENAGAQTGTAGTAAASGAAADQLAAGQSTASGIVGQSNAMTTGLNGALSNSLMGYLLSNQGSGSNAGSSLGGLLTGNLAG